MVVLVSFQPRRTPLSRHVTKTPSPQLLSFQHIQNRDARNSFKIRFYANCRVSLVTYSLFSLFATRVLHNSFAIMRLRTLLRSLALLQNSTPLFSSDSALFGKNTGSGGTDSRRQMHQPYSAH